jgi:hypothetical protein
VFCAPNKVWEYAGFGLPLICNNLPALQFAVGDRNAGVCVDMNDQLQIESALLTIDNHYEQFSRAAKQLYDSVDIRDIIRQIMNGI